MTSRAAEPRSACPAAPDRAPIAHPSGHCRDRFPRIEGIDALRGFALFGIFQVNIQGFAWGAADPLGYLNPPVGTFDIALRFVQAAFFEGKFYPIFAFLFGAGLAMQTRKFRHMAHSDAAIARRALHRRLWILLGMGIAHGFLLYCGDVLGAYAVCGLLFLWALGAVPGSVPPGRLRAWGVACAVGAAATIFFPLAVAMFVPGPNPAGAIPTDLLRARDIYVQGGLLAQLAQRRDDEIVQQLGSIPMFWPQVFAFLALGMLAGRAGWLHHPQRYTRVWAAARRIGLTFGLPCAIAGGIWNTVHALRAPGQEGGWDDVLLGASSLLAAAYVAGLLAWFATDRGARVARWLAYAGRMSLTNYVGQSLAMNGLLSAWGLGLGAHADRGGLAALGAAVFAAQIVLSRWILSRYRQGPLEAMWRIGTYAGLR